ncbi:hypothetical protein RF263_13180, partial [Acinetobacter baumannii]|nr:hypothetical protein [Acinetobacter baumannii]
GKRVSERIYGKSDVGVLSWSGLKYILRKFYADSRICAGACKVPYDKRNEASGKNSSFEAQTGASL